MLIFKGLVLKCAGTCTKKSFIDDCISVCLCGLLCFIDLRDICYKNIFYLQEFIEHS